MNRQVSSSSSAATRFSGQNVVITGGTSGIGLASAREFAQRGSHLYLLARDGYSYTGS